MKFILPNIGEGIDTMSVSEILVEENQKIEIDTSILLVETDKASMEIPIDCSCTIKKILIQIGDFISPGQAIFEIDKNEDVAVTIESNRNEKTEEIETILEEGNHQTDISEKHLNEIATTSDNEIHATPAVRKLARELNISIEDIKGTGSNQRVTKEDIHNHTNPNDDRIISLSDSMSKWGLVEEISLNLKQIRTGKKLYESWNTIPHVTQFDEVDITKLYKLVRLLKKVNKNESSKVSYIPFFIKTAYYILKNLKIFNSSLNTDKKSIIQKHYYNIGFAVDTNEGLVVPVIKNVDKKSIKQITIELNELVNKARKNSLTIDDISGGCFTISSLGNIGGAFFTPIINPPEVAILGVSTITTRPVLKGEKFTARKILPISLSYDHRVINGVDSAKFTTMFCKIIETPEKL